MLNLEKNMLKIGPFMLNLRGFMLKMKPNMLNLWCIYVDFEYVFGGYTGQYSKYSC